MDLPRHVLVLGFRRPGQAVAAALAARGVHVRAADARPTAALGVTGAPAGVELRFGEDGPQLLAGVELVVPSPGVPRDAPVLAPAARRGIPVWSEIELAFRLLACPLVAITGTNGKSTTTSLVGLALERAGRRTFIGGNLGTPLISALDQAPEIAVAEVSSFQLEWVERLRPRVGCLLNLTPDHLDRHASFAEYGEAKARRFAAQEAEDFAVVNRDDAEAWRAVAGVRARIVSFGAGAVVCGASAGEGFVALRLPAATEERYGLGRTRLAGRHNVENILAAVTVARLAGAPPAAVQAAIDEIEPLPHRLARVAERGGVAWYDDSKATNVGAAAKSLDSFAGPVVLLAGGVDKGGGYDALAASAAGKVRLALVFGEPADRVGASLLSFRKHLLSVGLGTLVAVVASRLSSDTYRRAAYPLLVVVLVALVLVLVPGIGLARGGARRWLHLGPLSVQPSELAKFALVLYLARSLVKKGERLATLEFGILPHYLVVGLVAGLVLLEPDFGTAALAMGLLVFMLFVGGVPARLMAFPALTALPALAAVAWKAPYRWARIVAFLYPDRDPLGVNFQLQQSFIAFGSGGLWGVGLGESRQKMFYLPEAHTDFLFSVIGEELGLAGALVVLALFAVVAARGFRIAVRHQDRFASLIDFAVTLALVLQGVVHARVLLGCLPTKGLALPFLSYGGSAMIAALGQIGVLLALARESG